MYIEANNQVGTSEDDWIVVAHWYGKDRIVFRGTIFKCITFKDEHKEPGENEIPDWLYCDRGVLRVRPVSQRHTRTGSA